MYNLGVWVTQQLPAFWLYKEKEDWWLVLITTHISRYIKILSWSCLIWFYLYIIKYHPYACTYGTVLSLLFLDLSVSNMAFFAACNPASSSGLLACAQEHCWICLTAREIFRSRSRVPTWCKHRCLQAPLLVKALNRSVLVEILWDIRYSHVFPAEKKKRHGISPRVLGFL